jgi:hypothetical protein
MSWKDKVLALKRTMFRPELDKARNTKIAEEFVKRGITDDDETMQDVLDTIADASTFSMLLGSTAQVSQERLPQAIEGMEKLIEAIQLISARVLAIGTRIQSEFPDRQDELLGEDYQQIIDLLVGEIPYKDIGDAVNNSDDKDRIFSLATTVLKRFFDENEDAKSGLPVLVIHIRNLLLASGKALQDAFVYAVDEGDDSDNLRDILDNSDEFFIAKEKLDDGGLGLSVQRLVFDENKKDKGGKA